MGTKRYNVRVGPPPKPNRKKWPFVGTIRFAGMTIHVENLPGQVRGGTDNKGKKWKTKMKWPYGEIHKTMGLDGDKVDVYVGPDSSSKKVYVVNQNHPKGHPKAGQFDEQKVMLGFGSAAAAKRAYLAHYDSDSFFRSMTEMGLDQFKKSVMKEDKGEKIAVEAAYRAGFKRALDEAEKDSSIEKKIDTEVEQSNKAPLVLPDTDEGLSPRHYPLISGLIGGAAGIGAGSLLGRLAGRRGGGAVLGGLTGTLLGGAAAHLSPDVRKAIEDTRTGIDEKVQRLLEPNAVTE